MDFLLPLFCITSSSGLGAEFHDSILYLLVVGFASAATAVLTEINDIRLDFINDKKFTTIFTIRNEQRVPGDTFVLVESGIMASAVRADLRRGTSGLRRNSLLGVAIVLKYINQN